MWSSENERKGFQQCTPAGYTIHGIGGLVLFAGGLCAVVSAGLLLSRTFHRWLLWLILIPVALLVIGWLLDRTAWWLAERKGFKYDYKANKCTWNGS